MTPPMQQPDETPLEELCRVSGFPGTPPSTLSFDSVLSIIEWTQTDIDWDGNLGWLHKPDVVPLKHGLALRAMIGP